MNKETPLTANQRAVEAAIIGRFDSFAVREKWMSVEEIERECLLYVYHKNQRSRRILMGRALRRRFGQPRYVDGIPHYHMPAPKAHE